MVLARTYILQTPHMRGGDITNWQNWLNGQMDLWRVNYHINNNGEYDQSTRDLTASVCHGLGMTASEAMKDGVTPELRIKLRGKRLSPKERVLSAARKRTWLPGFRKMHERSHVSTPIPVITGDSWGWFPPKGPNAGATHDGVDLICAWKAPLLAICDGEIVRAAKDGWWGKGAHSSAGHPIGDGDGIIILRCTRSVGPFKKGMNFCYGHAEGATVRVGNKVHAGQLIGHAGWANAAHVHFMVNDNSDTLGVGDRNPLPYVNYARSHD